MKAQKLSFKQLAIATTLAGSAALSINPVDVQASSSGYHYMCVTTQYSETSATVECKTTGTRCSDTSHC